MESLAMPAAAPLSLQWLIINLLVGIALANLLRWHFEKYASTLSNRSNFAQIFPFIVLTTTLIITIVKSSLALSLGLVGALSIVRFRTPIKEPEELAYLFMAISMGLGLGADQTIPVIIASIIILSMMAFIKWRRQQHTSRNLYLSLDWQPDESEDQRLGKLNEILGKHVQSSDIRRYDLRSNHGEAVYFVDILNSDHLNALITDLKENFPGIGVTFIDQTQLPSV